MSNRSIWQVLGIPATRDRTAIRRAYAARLKTVHPEDDAEGFQALRTAYERALAMAARAEPAEAEGAPLALGEREPPGSPAADDAVPPSPPQQSSESAPGEQVSDAEVDALRAALQQLSESLHGDARSEEDALVALRAVLASPAMDSVSVRQQVEHAVGSMLLNSGLTAHGLIEAAISEFGWGARSIGDATPLSAAVIARRNDLRLLATISAKRSIRHGVYLALTQKPVGLRLLRNRLTLGLPRQVRQLLNSIYAEHRSLLDHLDRDALAWWGKYLETPQFGAASVWATLIAPIALLPFAGRVDGLPDGLLATYAAGAAATAGLLALVLFAISRPRAAWRARLAARAPAWLRLGWAPLVLLNLAAAACVPAPIGAFVPLTLVALAWALTTAASDQQPRLDTVFFWPSRIFPWLRIPLRLPRAAYRILGLFWLMIFWVSCATEMDDLAWRQTALPIVAAGVAFAVGHDNLELAWGRIAPRIRSRVLTVAAVVISLIPLALWSISPDAAYVPLAASGVAALVLAERVLSSGVNRPWRDRLFSWGWIAAKALADTLDSGPRHGDAALLAAGLWVLAAVAAGVLAALQEDRRLLAARPVPA